jgi:hypothetical protein
MKHMSKLLVAGVFALALIVPAASAQVVIPEVSVFPVTEPTAVGDTILQPGTYTIKLVPSIQSRNIVQITSQDGSTVEATVLSVPHQLEPGEELPNTMFVFYPPGDGLPRALRTWYAKDPVSNGGHDIVYEESRAKQLARLANTRVVSYSDEIAEPDYGTAELSVITPEATVETYTVPETRIAEVETETRTQIADAGTMDELPATASKTPLMALLGLLALVGAVVVRVVR